jgi:hypothetical protein
MKQNQQVSKVEFCTMFSDYSGIKIMTVKTSKGLAEPGGECSHSTLGVTSTMATQKKQQRGEEK